MLKTPPCATAIPNADVHPLPARPWLSLVMIVAALLVVAGATLARADEEPPASNFPGVEYDPETDRLKVSVEEESFQRIMSAVSQSKGLKIIVNEPAESDITTDFDYMPFEEGLMALLASKNYAIERSEDGKRIETVWVLGEATEAATRSTSVAHGSKPREKVRKMSLAQAGAKPSLLLSMSGVTPEQMDDLLGKLEQYEEETGDSVRDRLKAMRASIDPDFDPNVDAEEMSDRQLLDSVITSAFQALARGTPGKSSTSP